ncbi:MAG: hypothetical protein IJX99_08565 [Clostridia bacterium]|nr:hypothetical protein [Clostridia bacterium]
MSTVIITMIKSKILFDPSYIVGRLENELSDSPDNIGNVVYDTINIILEYTHRKKVPKEMENIVYRMTRDYYFINKYNSYKKSNGSNSGTENEEITGDVKKVKRGNVEIEFEENKNITKINGTNYNTGTINPDEDIILKKYASILNNFRLLRW